MLPPQGAAWGASRARKNGEVFRRRGDEIQFESWDCNHLLRTKLPISLTSSSLLPLHILRPFFLPSLFYFRACGGVGKAAAFLRLLFKDILNDAATAAPSTRAAAVSVPAATGWMQPPNAGLGPLTASGSMPRVI